MAELADAPALKAGGEMQSTRAGSNPAIATKYRIPGTELDLENWSHDPDNHADVVYHPGLDHPVYHSATRNQAGDLTKPFEFAGWKFIDTEPHTTSDTEITGRKTGILRLYAVLHNPEHGAYLSYHTYSEAPAYLPEKEKVRYDWELGKYFAAAWLIAHWYEHYFHNCPCQVNDAKPSHFRFAFIETMLYMLS